MADNIVEINTALCESLGIEAGDVKGITVTIAAHTAPTVNVEYSWPWIQEHLPHLSRVVGEFQLTKKTD